MSILVSCDACGKELRAKDEAAGKQAKCPNCKAIIQIPHPEEVVDAEADDYGDTLPSAPQDDFGDDRQPCPACGEMISSTARKCRYCDEDLLGASPKKKKSSRSGRSSRRSRGGCPTADLGKRFLGAFVDGFAGLLFVGPGYGVLIASGVNDRGGGDESLAMIGLGLIVLGVLALLGAQLYLLVARSQSIGKWMVNTQIWDYETNEPAGFVKTFVLRSFVNGLIGAIPCIGPIYSLVDICVIFGEEHRCLHDQIAGTYVVDIS
jgi:uncharacterized RDD family membrane protein YckC/phage FluMu protein Com